MARSRLYSFFTPRFGMRFRGAGGRARVLARPFAFATVMGLLTGFVALPPLPAASSEWRDRQGAQFKAEPVEVLGPFALFRTSRITGRRMLWRGLTPEDAVRFHQETASRPPRARNWAEAKGAATSEAVGGVLRLQNGLLVPADLTQAPEPDILILIFGSHNDGESWQALHSFSAIYNRIQRVYPGRVEAIFMGVRHDAAQHVSIVRETRMPWLVADFPRQGGMKLLSRYAPGEGPALVALSRDGAPLAGGAASTIPEIAKFADSLAEILGMLDPANHRHWRDRFEHQTLVRPLQFARGSAPPLLIGDPLRADGLRQRKVVRIEAALAIAADGGVTGATLLPGSAVPEPMRAPLADALRKAVFVPAIENGRAVAGSYDYVFVVPPATPQADADLAWVSGEARKEIPIASWFLLKPIRVEEQAFNMIDRVDESGTVVLKALNVSGKISGKSQMTAFNSDWFGEAGADSVRAVDGATQMVDGTELSWRKVTPAGEIVDFQKNGENVDYSIGYAWTEFEVPVDMDAWLGLGSDDGVKIWHNGALVNDRWIRRPSRLDEDVVPLRLKQGKNRLLIKIQNATGGWSFIARLRTR